MSLISTTTFTSSANSGTQSITVPSGTKLAILGVSGYQNVANLFSSGSVTLDGAAMSVANPGSDANTAAFMGAMFYRFTPTIGTVDLVWDWVGAGTMIDGTQFAVAFYDNDVNAVRDTFGGQNAASPHATDTLNAQSGDLAVAWAHAFIAASTPAWTWTNATERLEIDVNTAAGSFADATPSGNVVITADETQDGADGGISAAVFFDEAAGFEGTGALAAQAATLAGAALHGRTSSGALAAQVAAVSGAGVVGRTGSGALTAQAGTIVGAGVVGRTGSGALAVQDAALSGAGTVSRAGNGTLVVGVASIIGAGHVNRTATGSLEAQAALISGAGESSGGEEPAPASARAPYWRRLIK